MLDVGEIYFLESDGHDTMVRTARKTRLRSVRPLGDLEKLLKPHGFLRGHKSYLVNMNRIREVRLRKSDDNDWELKLDPPVNAVLPVGREHLAGLRRALGF
jgi:DNA-binding LytR/AlgR family response regulator